MSSVRPRSNTGGVAPVQRSVRRRRNPSEVQADSQSDPNEKLMHVQLPVYLLGGGVVVQFLAAWWGHWTQEGAVQAMGKVGAEIVTGTVVMLVAIFLVAKLRGFKLGSFWLAVLKLAAVSIAPAAVMALTGAFLRIVPMGGLINALIGFCLYFALLGVFFELDQADTWFCVAIIFVIGVGSSLLLRPLL
jgi:hypothetical protein